MNYRDLQKTHIDKLVKTDFFKDKMNGEYKGIPRKFVLQFSENNLYPNIYAEVKNYFAENKIAWWGGSTPTGHTLSSQVACLNHLFLLRNDEDAVTRILQLIKPEIKRAVLLPNDKTHSYISFEVVSKYDRLNEKSNTRGSNCTSLDAVMLGETKEGKRILFPIEWKYTECYGNTNKAEEKDKGAVRQERYNALIESEDSPIKKESLSHCYYEPFYQLMRQTLWANEMVKNKANEEIKADDYFHLHIIPKANSNLLHKKYKHCGNGNMETTWKTVLKDPSKYIIITPEEFLTPVMNNVKYVELVKYLRQRYWLSDISA